MPVEKQPPAKASHRRHRATRNRTRPSSGPELGLDDPSAPGVLEGILERIVYTNEENGWTVIRLKIEGKSELVTAVGSMPGIQPGENLRLAGEWAHDPKFGRQFRVESFVSVAPSTLVGIERYLGSGLIDGIGKEMARRLVAHFGIATLEVIDQDSDRLTEVEGIGPKRSAQIRKAWAAQRHIRDVMVFLQGHGVATSHAVRIFRRYGPEAIKLVRENPYRLATDIFGIGFKTADQIAANLGIGRDAPRRAEAGLLHVLATLADEGHVFVPRDVLLERARAMLEIDPTVLPPALEELARQHSIVAEPTGDAIAVYLANLHHAETETAARLRAIQQAPAPPVPIQIDAAIEWFEIRSRITLAPAQRDAVRRAIERKALVVTGGPGTGKTTVIRAITQILAKKGLSVQLCAPTGRAAKRMNEATGFEARTIHRLLEFSPRAMRFERHRLNPLATDCLVVDELSMVDIQLARSLFDATPDRCRLVLVGDADQLPSVGPGNVLHDLIASGTIDVVHLTEIFRQAQTSRIVTNAHRINHGQMPEWSPPENATTDFYLIERDEPEKAVETIKHLVAERIPRSFGFDPVDDIQVLTPMHRGALGAVNLNAELQQLLTPPGPALARGGFSYRAGDKVMQIRNNYDLDVFNGDIGRVRFVVDDGAALIVRFENRDLRYDRAALDELTLAYACSIHKSQGSEYPAVVIPIHTQHYVMLQRNLLYTGITRGKRLVVLVGTKKAVAIAVKNAEVAARWTRLGERLRAKERGESRL